MEIQVRLYGSERQKKDKNQGDTDKRAQKQETERAQ